MFHIQRSIAVIGVILVAILTGCSSDDTKPILYDTGDEESNIQLTVNESYDAVRAGARLILAYDTQSKSFKGTVENTTNSTLQNVRVEVHLSNGTELGPTTPVDLLPGAKMDVQLASAGETFDRWTAHPEVGTGGGGGEGGSSEGTGEHSSGEGGGEHGGGGNHN